MKYLLPLVVLVLMGAGCRPPQPEPGQSGVACTLEAKICPDGSSVGRQGPACEFAPCPAMVTSTPPVIATSTPFVLPFTKDNLIRVDAGFASTTFVSPMTVTGTARGGWYFEASFPVELRDANNALMASSVAQAQGDWMTNDYVPFTTTLTFGTPTTATGTLILKKDNPSGMPQNDNQLAIPVRF